MIVEIRRIETERSGWEPEITYQVALTDGDLWSLATSEHKYKYAKETATRWATALKLEIVDRTDNSGSDQ